MRFNLSLIISGLLCFIVLINSASSIVLSDKGMVSVNTVDIPLEEPGQKAIICWDGTEEIMILSTDVRADSETKVLEIFPLPSEPTIRISSNTVFEDLELIVEERSYTDEKGGSVLGLADTGIESDVDVEIIFHDILGVHNLTVIKANTSEGFALCVTQFMEEIGLDPPDLTEVKGIAESYISREINYFVLDILELTNEVKSPQPLLYRFNSTSLYYPMEITSLTGGESRILLFILTPHEVVKGAYIKKESHIFGVTTKTFQDEKLIKVKTPDSPVNFELLAHVVVHASNFELYAQRHDEKEDPGLIEIGEFFGDNRVKICVYEYQGSVEMEGDIYISEYSVHTVKTYEEHELNGVNVFITIFFIPTIIVIVLFVIFLRIISKHSYM